MKCTACKQGTLNPGYLESMLPSHSCDSCNGVFLRMVDYFRWQEREDIEDSESREQSTMSIHADETSRALICPKTGGLMTKYRVSKDTDHRLDFSAGANAVWLDRGEWALLKAAGLSARLNNIFTHHWQKEIHAKESSEVMAELYQRRFGENYAALKEFRLVLESMDEKHEAIAYLIADDPYKA